MLADHVLHHALDRLGGEFFQLGLEQQVDAVPQRGHVGQAALDLLLQLGTQIAGQSLEEFLHHRAQDIGPSHADQHAKGRILELFELTLDGVPGVIGLQQLHQAVLEPFARREQSGVLFVEPPQVGLVEEMGHDQILHGHPDLLEAIGYHPGPVQERHPVEEHLDRQPVGHPPGKAKDPHRQDPRSRLEHPRRQHHLSEHEAAPLDRGQNRAQHQQGE